MKRFMMIGVLCTIAVLAATAQESSLPFVDIDTANAEIQQLQADNQEKASRNEELRQENEQLRQQIIENQQTMVEIDPILSRVESQLTDLFAVNRTIVDQEMKNRSQEAIGRARTIKTQLQAQQRTLAQQIAANREQIESNEERIRINDRRVSANEDRVVFLEAAIRQTQAQQERLDSFITNVDGILSDAERYVDTSTPAEGE